MIEPCSSPVSSRPAVGLPPIVDGICPAKPGRSKRSVALVATVASLVALGLIGAGVWLRASDTTSGERKSDSGLSYKNDRTSRVPWSVHIAKIDRSRKEFSFYTPLARGKVLGVSTITDQARSTPKELGRAIAGVNGDFYERDNPTFAGDPRGLQIVNGELVSAPSTVCVWFDADNNPHLDDVKGDFNVTWPGGAKTAFGLNQQRVPNRAVLYTPTYGPSTRAQGGRELVLERDGDGPWLPLRAGWNYRARIREIQDGGNTALQPDAMVLSLGTRLANPSQFAVGDVLEISTATTPDLKGAKAAIGGGPVIVRNGKPFALKSPPAGSSEAYSERSKYERHPRSAVGWNETHVFLITVDGRQPGLSVGMTLAELGEYMARLGCTEAMNFDGGASASIWVLGQVANNPCQGERPVANSLLVVRKDKAAAQ